MKTKIITNIFWEPTQGFQDFINKNKEKYLVVNGGASLINKQDEWIKNNVIFDNSKPDNISFLNNRLNEMTSLYFIWKN
jgi:hypothetical protein